MLKQYRYKRMEHKELSGHTASRKIKSMGHERIIQRRKVL